MVNYRGIAVNRQLDETIQLVKGWNHRLDNSNAKHLQRSDELGWGTPEWRKDITTTTPNNRMELQGINRLDPQVFRNKGRGTTLKMFSGFHGFMSRINKTVAWDFLMRYPTAFGLPHTHPILDTKLGETYVNGMCRLSDAFFLKYAWHVEGEQNVWDVQYRGLSISDDFPLNSVMRLPYPVMWFDAPSGGYTLEPPKKRLFNKLEKSGIDAIYKKKIGGILLMEVDILPVQNDVPLYKRTSLALKNMIWQIPDVIYGDAKTVRAGMARGVPSIHMNDYEYASFFIGGYDMQKLTNRPLPFGGKRPSLENDVISLTLTRPIPMAIVEDSINYKEDVADMLWDVRNTQVKNHNGVVLTEAAYENCPVDDFPNDMVELEKGFVTIRYDGKEDELKTWSMTGDDYAVTEMFHVRIDNFPTENNSVQGVMMSRRINPLAGELDTETLANATDAMTEVIIDMAKGEKGYEIKDNVEKIKYNAQADMKKEFLMGSTPATLSAINKRRKHLSFASNSDSLLLPQFMVMGFNDESIRSENSMQGWTRPDFENMHVTKGNTPHNFKNEKQREYYLEGRLDRIALHLHETDVRNDSMRLVWPMWRAIRDDFYGEKYGWTSYHKLPDEGTKEWSNALHWPYARNNAIMGMRYDSNSATINHCVDSCFAVLEEFGISDKGFLISHLFPDFDEEKDHSDLFLAECKREVKEAEQKKLQKIFDMSDETAFEYREYGDADSIKNMLVKSKTFSNVPYDTYNYINDDNVQKRVVSSYLCSKYWMAKNDVIQNFGDSYPQRIHDTQEDVRAFWQQGKNKGSLCTANSMNVTMAKALRQAYAQALRWHKNEAEMGKKLILASVYSVDGDILMQLPIPPMDSIGELTEYVDNIWAHHGILDEDMCAEMMKESLEKQHPDGNYPDEVIAVSSDCDLEQLSLYPPEEDSWVERGSGKREGSLALDKRVEDRVKETTGLDVGELEEKLNERVGLPSSFFDAENQEEYLQAHKHFGKETVKLVIGLLEFMNRPEIHIDARPFEVRRGAKLRGKGNKYKAERVNKEEENLMRKNHVLRRTGVVKKYLDMPPITDSRGRMKRHYVPTHSRMQPYPTRGTIEKIWVDGYFRGEGEMTSRPRIKIVDKRTHGEEE